MLYLMPPSPELAQEQDCMDQTKNPRHQCHQNRNQDP